MLQSEERWLGLADAFCSAAIDGKGWYEALAGLAEATGSRSGELIGVGSNAAVPFNLMTDMDPGFQPAFVAAGGGDPAINPRVGTGMRSPVLKVMAEADFMRPDEHRHHPHYREFAQPWDIPYICLATLERSNGMLIGLAVLRSARQGHIEAAQRRVFATLAPHVRGAVRMQIALEEQGVHLLAGAMEALTIAAFVCDRTGRVRALSPAGEKLLGPRHGLRCRLGVLGADRPAEARALDEALDAVGAEPRAGAAPLQRTVVLKPASPADDPLVLDVVRLPSREFQFSFAPRVLVVARSGRAPDVRKLSVLQAAYGLTPAESEVAVQLADGRSAEIIAAQRGVSLGTVRSQIRAILGKLEMTRQIELVARVGRL